MQTANVDLMSRNLFMFLARGVASEMTTFRSGARHALMLYGTGASRATARSAAVAGAENRGWQFVEVRRETELDADTSTIADEVLRSAAETAARSGFSMVVYEDEVPSDG